ncbi:putative 3-ketosphinganine reductase, partial [Trachipleistophora hominis]
VHEMLSLILLSLLCTFALVVLSNYKRPRKYQNKNILIIGGTSGLGLSLALKLSNHNNVSVTGRRTFDTAYLPLRFIRMDIMQGCIELAEYDAVFYCAGYAVAKYFVDLEWEEIVNDFSVNYFGAVRVLRMLAGCGKRDGEEKVMKRDQNGSASHRNDRADCDGEEKVVKRDQNGSASHRNDQAGYDEHSTSCTTALSTSPFRAALRVMHRGSAITNNRSQRTIKPRDIVLIGTPLAFFAVPGYAAYSPSKSALYNLFLTIQPELRKLNIYLYFYIMSTTKTPGYDRENITKPAFTKRIETWTEETGVDERSDRLLDGMAGCSVVTSDWLVEIMRGNMECGVKGVVMGWIGSIIFLFYRRYMNYLFMHEK